MRRTKIVCTVGPASNNPAVLKKLIQNVDVFRINFSHGNRASHLAEIKDIRRLSQLAGKNTAILQDLPGPKIRIGKMRNGSADLLKGSEFTLTEREALGDERRATVNNPDLLSAVDAGDTLHLADGMILLRVERKTEKGVVCVVLAGGILSSGKGLNAPGVKMKVEYPTPQDVEHVKFGVRHSVDFIAASFVRTPDDLRDIRKLMKRGEQFLIAKIEKREAVKNFDSILEEADGVMVARGDLGIETPIESVPSVQKEIISKCNTVGKPVIVATQMLMSMVNSPVPSRAEVTDVSTAILDGTDAVMLSDETAVGKYPVESVLMLDRIARSNERMVHLQTKPEAKAGLTEEAIGRAACGLADYVGAKAIVAPTQTGSTARRVSMFKPTQPIVALCIDPRVARRMMLYRGVIPVLSKRAKSVDWLFQKADAAVEELGLAKTGDRVVVTSGTPGVMGSTNLIKVSVVGTP